MFSKNNKIWLADFMHTAVTAKWLQTEFQSDSMSEVAFCGVLLTL